MMNSLCVSAHIPRIALTNKQAVLQSNNINRASEKGRQIHDDVAYSVESRMNSESRIVRIS